MGNWNLSETTLEKQIFVPVCVCCLSEMVDSVIYWFQWAELAGFVGIPASAGFGMCNRRDLAAEVRLGSDEGLRHLAGGSEEAPTMVRASSSPHGLGIKLD